MLYREEVSMDKKQGGNGKGTWARLKKDYLANWRLYLFLVIPIVYIIIFAYVPMAGVQLALKKYDFTKGIWGSEWIGFANFERFFKAYNFSRILKNTVTLSFYSLLAGFPIPILFALLVNAFPGRRTKKLVQTVSYMPHFISTVVVVGMIVQILNPRTGAFGAIYTALTGEVMRDVLANPHAFPHIYVWSGIWQGMGWSSIIYIAALAGVDPELHEAAQIDGASRLQRIFHVDFPAILPTTVIMLILSAGNIMNVGFEKVYLMQNNMNQSASEVISTYVYKVGMSIGTGDFAFATAIGLFNSLINFALLVTVNTISKRVSGNSLW